MAASNLHYHFKTKHDLLLALLAEIQDRFHLERGTIMLQEAHSLRERLAVFFEQKKALILEQPRYDKVQFDFWLLGQSDETVKQDFRRSFDHWRGHLVDSMLEFYPQMKPEYARDLSYVLVSMMMGASMQYLNGDGVSLDRYFSRCLDMVIGEVGRRTTGRRSSNKNWKTVPRSEQALRGTVYFKKLDDGQGGK